jgi:hypothetical protein
MRLGKSLRRVLGLLDKVGVVFLLNGDCWCRLGYLEEIGRHIGEGFGVEVGWI